MGRRHLCGTITASATANGLPIGFFTRLIWQESSLRANATSPAGAQGIAQFMPGTAADRGLANPFDPETAIAGGGEIPRRTFQRFGNLGLAAAAYNAGPNPIANCLAGQGDAPLETRAYVFAITARPLEEWVKPQPIARPRRHMRRRARRILPANRRGHAARRAGGNLRRDRRSRPGACNWRAISPRTSRSPLSRGPADATHPSSAIRSPSSWRRDCAIAARGRSFACACPRPRGRRRAQYARSCARSAAAVSCCGVDWRASAKSGRRMLQWADRGGEMNDLSFPANSAAQLL